MRRFSGSSFPTAGLPCITGVLIAAGALTALPSLGCGSSLSTQERVVVAVDNSPPLSSEPVALTEPAPLLEPAQPAAPPSANRRLSHTVTLGQGTTEGFTPMPAAESQGNGGGPNVVVNNNVTVVGGTPVYGGYYGGYGYGYGYGGARGTGTAHGEGQRSGNTTYGGAGAGTSGAHQAWAPSGWEGAQRTAAPGHTPAVGGNYSPAPNSGPAPMR